MALRYTLTRPDKVKAIILQVADQLVNGIQNAGRMTLAGGGHLISMTAPEAFNRAVNEFLQREI